ncbi:hypothetical protein ACEYYH_10630 [Microbacterium trichothecenolyticum]|uniref:hypothetical protein n=1 Tax=Microbacterium trichothecenolyticum TaxID=69370 RepID=UPI0035BE5041
MAEARIDREERAQELLIDASAYDLTQPATAARLIAAAQAHATLALVEQQRIANLIALGMYKNADGSRLAQHAVATATGLSSVALREDIREGLGL